MFKRQNVVIICDYIEEPLFPLAIYFQIDYIAMKKSIFLEICHQLNKSTEKKRLLAKVNTKNHQIQLKLLKHLENLEEASFILFTNK